jgi:signal transduction histidine kinase/CheY-like chemotaxis protein
MKPDHALEIRDEQVRMLFRQARIVFLPNGIAAPALAFALWDSLPHAALLAWVAAVYAITALRAAFVWDHGHRSLSAQRNLRWGWMLAAMNALSGSFWGAAGFLFLPEASPLGQAFIIVCVAAMTSGAVSSLSAFGPAYVMFAVPCVAPLIARCLLQWRGAPDSIATTYLLLAILTLVYLTVHLVFSRNTQRTLVESIRLRFEKLDLLEEITRAKERAEAASVAKSRFLAAASHDLRQPMHALGLFIDALHAEPQAARAAQLLGSVMESHQAATGLLENLLEFSKVDAGITQPALVVFPVQRLLDQLRAEYSLQASAADLKMRVHPSSAFVMSDPVLLARVVGNFVSNAIRYTEEGRIVVGCRRERGRLRIEVHDTGIGIPAGEQRAIFREFYQVAAARRRRNSVGMGLGLAIVAGLAHALDHPVTVRSTPGKGSAFAVGVHAAAGPVFAAQAPPALDDELRGRCILVIDDEESIRHAVAEVLQRWGCRAIIAADAVQALAACKREGAPDAIVVDYQLADDRSGLEAIAAIETALGRRVPAIIVTGDTRPERLREAGAIGHLLLYKPLAPMRLRAALAAVLQPRVEEAATA